ncbi:hypothetical protein EDD16DRAFT_1555032 [Pisolithus croceorrhizus]|nr:hypothetical protein EDD16DRAFT_1555032 [Pisolithus croceorrhizus]
MPVNSSYYPLPNGANAHPPRSPPPFNRPFKMSHSPQPSVGDEQSDSMLNPGHLWFCDGSIVLRAENTLFRVHKSLLARHSGFFHDLFTLPQLVAKDPSPPRGDVEGCQDVANLLTALVDGPYSGILRLSTKYLVDALREKALNHLALAWPTTLKGWDAREDIARAQELRDGSAAVRIYPSPIAVINLAREVNAPALLPSAFLTMESPFDESAWRFPLSNAGHATTCARERRRHSMPSPRSSGRWDSLTHSLHGHPLGFHSHTHGHIHRTCKRDFAELVALATQHYLFDHERGCMDPLYVAEELGQPRWRQDDYRHFGASRRGIEQAEERERMWKMIPLWFRLDV